MLRYVSVCSARVVTVELKIKPKGLEDVLTFGRYKGLTVAQVVDEDPDYIIWMSETLEYFPLEESVVDLAIEAALDNRVDDELKYGMRLADILDDDYY